MHSSPSLIQVNEEHGIIPKAGQSMRGGHRDNEGEDVIDERVERLRSTNR